MKKVALAVFLVIFCKTTQGDMNSTVCNVSKLPGIKKQQVLDWDVSLEKEALGRKKSGDAFVAIRRKSGRKCEIELESWASNIYALKGVKFFFVVKQGDTDYGQLDWIDPDTCKITKTLREIGDVKISNSGIVFSGGRDGPDSIPATTFQINADCLPDKSAKSH